MADLDEALEAYIAKRSYANMMRLNSILEAFDDTSKVAAFWAAVAIAVDNRAEAAHQAQMHKALNELMKDAIMEKKNEINVQGGTVNVGQVGSNVVSDSTVSGSVGASQVMTDCLNQIRSSSNEQLSVLLEQLHTAIFDLLSKTKRDQVKKDIEQDYATLVKEVTQPQPRGKWYDISGEGLIDAANAVIGLGERVAKLLNEIKTLPLPWR